MGCRPDKGYGGTLSVFTVFTFLFVLDVLDVEDTAISASFSRAGGHLGEGVAALVGMYHSSAHDGDAPDGPWGWLESEREAPVLGDGRQKKQEERPAQGGEAWAAAR